MIIRPRRLRKTPTLREMVRETNLSVKDFIAPLFVKHGASRKDEITSMPGQYQFSPDSVVKEAEELWSLGVSLKIIMKETIFPSSSWHLCRKEFIEK